MKKKKKKKKVDRNQFMFPTRFRRPPLLDFKPIEEEENKEKFRQKAPEQPQEKSQKTTEIEVDIEVNSSRPVVPVYSRTVIRVPVAPCSSSNTRVSDIHVSFPDIHVSSSLISAVS